MLPLSLQIIEQNNIIIRQRHNSSLENRLGISAQFSVDRAVLPRYNRKITSVHPAPPGQLLLRGGLAVLLINHAAVRRIRPAGFHFNPCRGQSVRALPENLPRIRRHLHLLIHYNHILGQRALHVELIHKMRVAPPAVLRIEEASAVPHDRKQLRNVKMSVRASMGSVTQHGLNLLAQLPSRLPAAKHGQSNVIRIRADRTQR